MIHYIALYNENYPMPAKPDHADEGILRGMYRLRAAPKGEGPIVRLIGSGPIMIQVLDAVEKLQNYGVRCEIYSATSYGELRRDGLRCERENRLHPQNERLEPYAAQLLKESLPTIAVSDNMAAVPEMIREWVNGPYTVLGTDGFGRSDTRENLRRFFEIDGEAIALASLSSLVRHGGVEASIYEQAIHDFNVSTERIDQTE